MEGGKICNQTYPVQGSIRTNMRNSHHKTLITGNYHTKDKKQLTYEMLQEYQKHTAKKTPKATYTVSGCLNLVFFCTTYHSLGFWGGIRYYRQVWEETCKGGTIFNRWGKGEIFQVVISNGRWVMCSS